MSAINMLTGLYEPSSGDASIYGMTCANRLPEGTGFTCFDELG